LADGLYGEYDELRRISEQRTFAYDEGLPGKAWASATPQIITDLEHSFFQRKEAVARAGINTGIAVPIFTGEFISAVVVLLCGVEKNLSGAIELWGKQNDRSTALSLLEGHYGPLKTLEEASRNIQFAKGNGLPGSVWDYHIPMLIPDMQDTELFQRASAATLEGITSAIGLPFNYYTEKEYVLTFLSAHRTPIARRFEIWILDREYNNLFFHAGTCEHGEDIQSLHQYQFIKRGEGILGQVWLTGIPAISRDLKSDGLLNKDSTVELTTALVVPIIEEGYLKSVVVFMF
jgi:hypothetical protein